MRGGLACTVFEASRSFRAGSRIAVAAPSLPSTLQLQAPLGPRGMALGFRGPTCSASAAWACAGMSGYIEWTLHWYRYIVPKYGIETPP